jgi:phosphate starvation-inducible PhoH-like protein
MKLYILLFFGYYISSISSFYNINKINNNVLYNKKKTIEWIEGNNKDIEDIIYEKEKDIYFPKTPNQQQYIDYLGNRNISVLLGIGPAGSGKTLFACSTAVKELKNKYIDNIIITRPLISVDEELGFLPGSLEEKMDPWTRPIIDALSEYYSISQIKSMIHNGIIEISPLAFMRGRTFKRSFIIADEMQNSSPNQMKMILTRLGQDSRMIITGDLKQSDRSTENGLIDFMKRLKKFDNKNDTFIKYIEFNNEDIQRSQTVSHILQIYDQQTIPEKKPMKKNIIEEISNNDAALIPKRHYDIGGYY